MIEALLVRLNEIALTLLRPGRAWEDWPRFEPPASPESVAEFERIVGFALPADIRHFLSVNDAVIAMSIHNGYWLGGVMQLIQLASQGDLPTSVEEKPAAPVATDGAGNAFLITRDGQVWRWNHETNGVLQGAESFGAFLERVADDWVAYVSNRSGWKFLV